jgi:hypothetical protein
MATTEVTSGVIKDASITAAKMAANSVDSASYVDGSIDPEHLADNAITLAKMASGTDGNVISYDASGNPVAIATGTDGQVLTSAGAGAQPAFETLAAGGAHTLIGSTVADDSASITVTGLDNTYPFYKFMWSDITAETAAATLGMRIGDSSGIDSGSADYKYHMQNSVAPNGNYSAEFDDSHDRIFISVGMQTASTKYGASGNGIIAQGFDGVNQPLIYGHSLIRNNGAEIAGGTFMGMRMLGSGTGFSCTQIQFFMSADNITAGRLTVWGISVT